MSMLNFVDTSSSFYKWKNCEARASIEDFPGS